MSGTHWVVSSFSSSSSLKQMNLLILWGDLRYAGGDAEFAHSFVDNHANVSISFHKGSYLSQYSVVLLIICGILCMGNQFSRYMNCGLILMNGEEQNQRIGSYLGFKMGVRLCVHELKS